MITASRDIYLNIAFRINVFQRFRRKKKNIYWSLQHLQITEIQAKRKLKIHKALIRSVIIMAAPVCIKHPYTDAVASKKQDSASQR
jgi:hypothetical protein